MNTPVAGNVSNIVVVTDELGRVAPRVEGVTSDESGLRAECRVLLESLGVVVCVELQLEVVVPDEASRCVDRLERVAATVTEAGTNSPAGLLLEASSAL